MLRRHDLLRIRPDGWAQVVAGSACVQLLADEPGRLVRGWAERGWPVIVRRRTPEESGVGIAVGLPLPPACGKLRLAFFIPPELVAETVAAVSLREEQVSIPANWLPQVTALSVLGERLALPPTVYGGLLWQHLTGLPYLHAGSDLDLLWPTPSGAVLPRLLDGLARLDAAGPVRVDGEITLASGCGVNWRELRQELPSPGGSVLVKSMNGADVRCAQTLFG